MQLIFEIEYLILRFVQLKKIIEHTILGISNIHLKRSCQTSFKKYAKSDLVLVETGEQKGQEEMSLVRREGGIQVDDRYLQQHLNIICVILNK